MVPAPCALGRQRTRCRSFQRASVPPRPGDKSGKTGSVAEGLIPFLRVGRGGYTCRTLSKSGGGYRPFKKSILVFPRASSPKKFDRNLMVKRWLKANPKDRKRLLWTTLTPATEVRIDLKGAPLTLEGKPLSASLKPRRSIDIHEVGYT